MSDREPRSVRNNNPGNIRVGDPWQGLADAAQRTAAQRGETAFCVFQAPKWGFRAMAIVLIAYQDRHSLHTIRGMIDRWAPPEDNNDTAGYIARVAEKLGTTADGPVDVHQYRVMRPLVEAIARVESGGAFPWADAEVDEGLRMAGVLPPQPAAVKDGGVIGAVGTALGGIALAGPEIVAAVKEAQPVAASLYPTWPWIAGGVLLLALGAAVLRGVIARRRIEA
ncbi:MAG: structural protein P5 [Alphaproteobacteria bacterium]